MSKIEGVGGGSVSVKAFDADGYVGICINDGKVRNAARFEIEQIETLITYLIQEMKVVHLQQGKWKERMRWQEADGDA